MSLSKDSAALFLSRFIASIGELFAIYLFTRILGPRILGTYFLYFAVISFISTIFDMGLTGAIEKRISEGKRPQVFLSSGVALNVILIVCLSTLVFMFHPIINSYLGEELAVFVIFGIVAQRSSHIAAAVLKGEMRVMLTAFFKPLRKTLWIIFGYIFYTNGFGESSLILSIMVSYIIVSTIGWMLIKTSFGPIRVSAIKSLFKYGKYHYISGNLYGAFYNKIDILLIGYYLSPVFVSAYEVAWRVSSMVMMLSQSISTAIFPQISYWAANNSKENINSVLPNIIIGSLFISIPAAFGALALRHELLGILFSPEYVIASQALVFLVIKSVTESYQTVLSSTINALDHPAKMALASIVTIISAIILNLFFIPQYGLAGAAFATLVAFIFNTAISHLFAGSLVGSKFPIYGVVKITSASVVMFLVLEQVKNVVSIDSIRILLSVVSLGIFTYLLMAINIKEVKSIVKLQLE